jgi:integrase
MSLKKRGNTWWIDFTTPGGSRVRRTAGTSDKAQAQELHDQLKAEAWRVVKLGEKPRRTWDEAALKWLDEKELEGKASLRDDKAKLRWLIPHLSEKFLDEISSELIAEIGKVKARESTKPTANRHLALIRSILRMAANDWKWIDFAPRVKLYPEPKRRVRWITPEQAKQLLGVLPNHQRSLTLFALATGLRQGNVLGLEWSQVDLERQVAWVFGDQAKGDEDIHISLNDTAMSVLRAEWGKHPTHVFTYAGKPIKQANTRSWRAALRKVGIENFRWHDLRHSWASWLVQNGTPLYTLQEMGAWKSAEMVRRYAHLAPANFRQHACVVDQVLHGTNTAHSRK